MSRLPVWLLPWLLPLGLVVTVIAFAVSIWAGVVLLIFWLYLPVRLRLDYLKENPPDPELRHRNFWDFRR